LSGQATSAGNILTFVIGQIIDQHEKTVVSGQGSVAGQDLIPPCASFSSNYTPIIGYLQPLYSHHYPLSVAEELLLMSKGKKDGAGVGLLFVDPLLQ
jgi:hypothetical protein